MARSEEEEEEKRSMAGRHGSDAELTARDGAPARYNSAQCDRLRPEATGVASFTYRRQLTIEWGQCDPAGIVFNSRFFEIFDTATWQMFEAALGVKPHEIAAAFGIVGFPLVDARANFIRPIKFRRRRRRDLAGERIPPFQLRRRAPSLRSVANWRWKAAKPASGLGRSKDDPAKWARTAAIPGRL